MTRTTTPPRRPRAAGLLTALLGLAALAACEKGGPQNITAAAPGARVKFFNFGVGAPSVNFYANDAKITAVSSTSCTPLPTPPADSLCKAQGVESTNGTAYGAAAAGGFYVGLAPGQYTFSGRITAAANNGLPIASIPASVADGKNYSVYLSGFYDAAAKRADGFVLEDAYPDRIAYDSVYLRFVNAIPNAGPLTLFFRNPTTSAVVQVSPAVAYKSASNFRVLSLPTGFIAALDLVARTAGSTANAITNPGVTLSAGRVYTVTARGDITVTSSTAANRPQLDNTANR